LTVLYLMFHLGGCAVLYLTHRHQGWLARPLGSLWRIPGVLALLLALGLALRLYAAPAALFLWSVLAMLAFSLLPFVTLLLPERRHAA
jgi:hypothetical protein